MEWNIACPKPMLLLLLCHPQLCPLCSNTPVACPPHDQPPLIEQQTEFAANNPAMIGEAFAANLLGTTAFTHGMDQLNTLGVNDAEHGRGSQESPRPILMGLEETKEPGALGKPRK